MNMTKLTNRIGSLAMAFVFLFGIFIVSGTVAEAQWRDRNNDRREDRRNNRWGNTNKRAIENLVRRVEDRTDSFVRQFDRALDNSRVDGTRREDRLNELASELERATNQLRREFDRSDSLQENRDEVERCISIASRIDRAVSRGRIGNGVQNSWRTLRNELNALARAYNVRSI
ncbi:MAG TPA: hypothetical protein VF644_17870 [Pyrinomonadaceae bacterium]|jgi:hypothetical protein